MLDSLRAKASLLGLLLLLAGSSAPLPAAPPAIPAESLAALPRDTVFYTAWLRNREQIERVAKSNFARRVLELPPVQDALKQFRECWENPTELQHALFKARLELPENRELQELLVDGLSDEVFIAGGASHLKLVEFGDTLTALQRQLALEQIEEFDLLEDEEKKQERTARQTRRLVETFLANLDRLVVPDTFVGMRISDPARAERQIARLEMLLRETWEHDQPELARRLNREQILGREFLVLRLDGSLVPWPEIEKVIDDPASPIRKEDLARLVEHARKMKLVVSLGVAGKFLVLHVGSSTEALVKMNQGPRLAERPELAPLAKEPERRVTRINFVGGEYFKGADQTRQNIDLLANMVGPALQKLEAPDELRREVEQDVRRWCREFAKRIEPPGAYLDFTSMTARGYERMSFAYGPHRAVDSTQRLTILDHLGGRPIAFGAGRVANVGEDYALLREMAQRGGHYFERYLFERLDAEEKKNFRKLKADLGPLVERFDRATRDALLPGLKDGQWAWVFDAQMLSPRWHPAMPPAARPLPFPELAYAIGVTDAKLVRAALREYFALVQEMVRISERSDPAFKRPLPDIKPPTTEETEAGTILTLALPEDWLVDRRIAPSAGLGERVAAASLAPETLKRMLAPHSLHLEGPVAAKFDGPLAGASHFDAVRLIEMLEPWIEYGIDNGLDLVPRVVPNLTRAAPPRESPVAAGEDDDNRDEKKEQPQLPAAPDPEQVKAHVRIVLSFLKCYRGTTTVIYKENGALVTHTEWHYEDFLN